MIEQQELQRFSQQLADFDDRLEWLRDTNGSLDRGVALAELETCREELRVAEEELRAQHEQLMTLRGSGELPIRNDQLLDDLPVATLTSDRLGLVTAANRLAAQLLGEPAHRIIGKPLAASITGDRQPFRQLLGRLASGDRLDRLQVSLRIAAARGWHVSSAQAVLIARRDADSVRWVVVPEDLVGAPSTRDAAAVEAREKARVAIDGLWMLPIARASLAEILVSVEALAAQALPAAGRVTLALDGAAPHGRAHEPVGGQPFPLTAHGSSLGMMYVADGPAGRLAPADQCTAQLFADAAAAVVSNARALQESRDLVDHLSHALVSRSVIEQAKGILMAVRNCDEDAAFEYLRAASQNSNTKLHEVARGLVDAMSTPNGNGAKAH